MTDDLVLCHNANCYRAVCTCTC